MPLDYPKGNTQEGLTALSGPVWWTNSNPSLVRSPMFPATAPQAKGTFTTFIESKIGEGSGSKILEIHRFAPCSPSIRPRAFTETPANRKSFVDDLGGTPFIDSGFPGIHHGCTESVLSFVRKHACPC
jgi:hypothetical protein